MREEKSLGPFQVGLLPRKLPVRVRTIDTGGAGPVSGLLEAVRMVKETRCDVRLGWAVV